MSNQRSLLWMSCAGIHLPTCICVGIHLGRVELASPIALTPSRSCASSLGTFTQSFFHRALPKTRGLKSGSRSALIVVAHILSWPSARLRHVRGGVSRRRSLITNHSCFTISATHDAATFRRLQPQGRNELHELSSNLTCFYDLPRG